MKKIVSLLLFAAILLSFAACGSKTDAEDEPKETAEPVELIVFAAASMQKVLTDIAEEYNKTSPEVKLTFTFDSSGTLKTQITEGAPCDIFISAGQKQMDAIDVTKTSANKEGLDFVLSETRFDLLENKIVLVVPADNPAGIESFDDLATDKLSLMAIGNADVPVGQYAAEILTYMKLYDSLESAGKITFGTNTTEVTTQISEKAVDCGIVYKTDVASSSDPAALKIVAEAPEGSVSRAIYPAAILKGSTNVEAAQKFLDFLKGDTAKALLEGYGFTTEIK